MGQFSVEKPVLPGSVLSGNQHCDALCAGKANDRHRWGYRAGMRSEIDFHNIATPSYGTRLSHWHPYPAMVADDLAQSIAAATVRVGSRVLDPFCGSGRLLMAASALGAQSHGFDVNPLAGFITEAKAADVLPATIGELARHAAVASRSMRSCDPIRVRHSKVPWFSEEVGVELAQIIDWLTQARLGRS